VNEEVVTKKFIMAKTRRLNQQADKQYTADLRQQARPLNWAWETCRLWQRQRENAQLLFNSLARTHIVLTELPAC
jgi:hypothetical protein